jgi:predicted MFS family arabinose efflux permease
MPSALNVRANRALDVLSFILSDVRYGLGAYLGVYLLTEHNWDAAAIGAVFFISGLAGVITQTPLGAMVDAVRAKRALLAVAVAVATGAALMVPILPHFLPVAIAGIAGALAGGIVGPALAAISLGIVGPQRFARRAGRNESLFHAGNAAVNLVILATAPFLGTPVLFWMMGATAIGSVVAAAVVPGQAIDHAVARGLEPDDTGLTPRPSVWRTLLGSRPLLIFAGCGALFHLANGSMLGLVAQKLALDHVGQGIALTAASAIAAQVVMAPTAALAGARADAWGRKPLLLAAFAALAARGALYTLSNNPAWLIGVQLLDGVGAGLIGALFPVVVADLTRGSGHFNAAQGAVGMVHTCGGILSQLLGGLIVVEAGYNTAFLLLAVTAGFGGGLFWLGMPESRDYADQHAPAERNP